MARRSKLAPLERYRQSTLAGFETCPRRTRFALEAGDDVTTGWVEASGDLGTVFHAIAAEMLRTMYRYGHDQMPTQEAVEIMREVYAAGTIVLPANERDVLTGLVIGFCAYKFNPRRIVALEKTLTLDITCPDGVVRRLKGQPDLISADPPTGLVIADYKTGMGKPKRPREPVAEGEAIIGKQYLSERGHFQLDTYGLLALKGVTEDGERLLMGAETATLMEIPLRWPGEPPRLATLTLDDLEHVEWQIGAHMMMLDRAIGEGPRSGLWKPRPGSHCAKQCPVARSCPIPREMRGDGAIVTQHQADVAARVVTVAGAQREQATSQSKAWVEAGNPPGAANEREELRWGPEVDAWKQKGGGRKFGLWPRDTNGNGAGNGVV